MRKILIHLMMVLFVLAGCGTSMGTESDVSEPINQSEKEAFELDESEAQADDEVVEDEEIDKETDLESELVSDQESGHVSANVDQKVSGKLKVHFINVGQADATLFQTGDVNVLFDAGNWNRRDVVDYLLSIGVEKIDLLIGSHPDADHIGQMSLILDQFEVDEVWMSGVESTSRTFERVIDKIFEHDVSYHEPRAGESYQIGSLSLDVIAPAQLTNDSNEDSISIYFGFGDTGIVLTGDAGVRAERAMLNARNSLSADILHVGHHGSSTSTDESFLKAVNPDYVIISAGADNSYGHPHDEVVDLLVNSGVEILATYQHGTIIFSSDGQTLTLDSTIKQAFVPDHVVSSGESGGSTVASKPNKVENPVEKPKKEESKPVSAGCIDINTASVEELMEIIHIGDVRVQELIDLRPHNTVNGLKRIKGIGDGRMKDIIEQDKACVR